MLCICMHVSCGQFLDDEVMIEVRERTTGGVRGTFSRIEVGR
jgi:hypothetical protein